MPIMLLLFLTLLGSSGPSSRPAEQAGQKVFMGCVNRLADGRLQFGTVPSGNLYLLQGQTNLVEKRVNQLVRVYGESAPDGSQNSAFPTLKVDRIQTMAGSCTSVLPAKKAEEVSGKVGEDMVDVPHGSTSAEDRTTPGFQTETSGQRLETAGGPAHPEQAGQSQAAADVDAGAVGRTEILPGKTLGVSGSGGNATNRGQAAPGAGE